jgi:hypothetical protein
VADDYDGPFKALAKEANEKLVGCRAQKREWDLDIREGYAFAAPHLARDIRSENAPTDAKPRDEDEILADASSLALDYLTEVLNAFMPEAEPWAEQRPGPNVPAAEVERVKTEAKEQDLKIFDAIKSSNLYTVLPVAWNPDLAVGTSALWIDDPGSAQNFICQAIPLKELEINIGPHGEVDDRFIVRHTRNRHVKALLPEIDWAKVPPECAKEIADKPDERTEVRWGYWRLWERRDDVVWQHVVMVKNKVVHAAELVGEGSCPLIVTRWNPSAQWAYGFGVLIKALRDLRLLDSILYDLIDYLERRLRPPVTYPDDSFASIEGGIEANAAYPIRPGTEDAVKAIYDGGDANAALFETEKIYERLRQTFYLGWPEQRGKTPPTLGQWVDEMARAQRRIGTPGLPFWREGPAQIFLRFKYLLQRRGTIQQIKVGDSNVALTPFNPAQRAAEQQEVAMAVQALSIAGQTFPEEFRLRVDGGGTMKNLFEKMRTMGLIKLRTDDEIKTALPQIAQLIEGRQRIQPVEPGQIAGL